jgi:hypothetical protein
MNGQHAANPVKNQARPVAVRTAELTDEHRAAWKTNFFSALLQD